MTVAEDRQLSLDFGPVEGYVRPWPEKYTKLRIYHKYQPRGRWPGEPNPERVIVYDGTLVKVVRAGQQR